MFTGLITDVGTLLRRDGGCFTIHSGYEAAGIALGASIACDGCCLTVTSVVAQDASVVAQNAHVVAQDAHVVAQDNGAVFTVDVSNESLAKTTLGEWQAGKRINLERALKAGDELGGHIVSGHVDGVAKLSAISEDGDSRRLTFEVPVELAKYIAPKGSVALDGTSLTVNEVGDATFGVNLIPHSLTVTNWGVKKPGDGINLEIDLFARYVARLMEKQT